MKTFINFLKREDGPTAVEYAVMLALIVVACIGAVQIQRAVLQCETVGQRKRTCGSARRATEGVRRV